MAQDRLRMTLRKQAVIRSKGACAPRGAYHDVGMTNLFDSLFEDRLLPLYALHRVLQQLLLLTAAQAYLNCGPVSAPQVVS